MRIYKPSLTERVVHSNLLGENNKSGPESLEQKAQTSTILNGKKTVGTLNLGRQVSGVVKKLVDGNILYIEDLKKTTFEELMALDIKKKTIYNIEDILKIQDTNFR